MDRKIINNISYLTLLQAGNYIVPLITVPYLIKSLGVEKFGLVMLAQSIMFYFVSLVDYGFSLTGVREISLSRENVKKSSLVFSEIIFTKVVLLVIGGFILLLLFYFYPKFRNEGVLLLTSYIIVVGNGILPIFFFQGVEKMQFITILTLVSKLLFALLVFIFIKTSEDYIWVNMLQGVGTLIAGIIGLYIAISAYNIRVTSPLFLVTSIRKRLVENWRISASTISITIYMNANGFILGFFVSPQLLGIYMIAEKIMFVVRQLLSVFSRAIYSHVCIISDKITEVVSFYRKVFSPFLILTIILCIGMFATADLLSIFLVENQEVKDLSFFIRLFSVVPLIVCLNIPFNLFLLAKDKKKTYFKILGFAVILYAVLAPILGYYFRVKGVIVTTIGTEILVTLLMIWNSYELTIKKQNGIVQKQKKGIFLRR